LQDAYIYRETIYSAIYALPVGELRKELIHHLRQGKSTRRPRRGVWIGEVRSALFHESKKGNLSELKKSPSLRHRGGVDESKHKGDL